MHHHRVDADGFENHNIAREGFGRTVITHGVAAVFNNKRMARKTLNVGQRFAHRFSGAQQQFLRFERFNFHRLPFFRSAFNVDCTAMECFFVLRA